MSYWFAFSGNFCRTIFIHFLQWPVKGPRRNVHTTRFTTARPALLKSYFLEEILIHLLQTGYPSNDAALINQFLLLRRVYKASVLRTTYTRHRDFRWRWRVIVGISTDNVHPSAMSLVPTGTRERQASVACQREMIGRRTAACVTDIHMATGGRPRYPWMDLPLI